MKLIWTVIPTSIDLSNEESIEEITLDDYEVCIDDIDVIFH